MNTYVAKKSTISASKIFLKIGILAVALVILNIFSSPIRNTFYLATSSLSHFLSDSGKTTNQIFGSFFNYQGLRSENTNLKKENQHLSLELALLKNSLGQTQAIDQMAANNQDNALDTVAAGIIGLDTQNDFILLNKGIQDGIRENMPVISSEKAVYGKITKVYNDFCQVMLISHKNSVVDVKIQSSDTSASIVHGAVKGQGNLMVGLDLVNSDDQIVEGELLTTSGLEGVFPKNLLVGKIQFVNKNDLQPFQTAKIQPFFDVASQENLFIIKNYKNPI